MMQWTTETQKKLFYAKLIRRLTTFSILVPCRREQLNKRVEGSRADDVEDKEKFT